MSRLPLLGIVIIAGARLSFAADPSSGPPRVVRAVAALAAARLWPIQYEKCE